MHNRLRWHSSSSRRHFRSSSLISIFNAKQSSFCTTCLRMRCARSRHLARSSISSRPPQKSGSLIPWLGQTIGSGNAGAGRLISRTRTALGYDVPGVVKTNIDVPSIVGGKQSVYFFPDAMLVIEGNRVGAIAYEDLDISWNTTVFVEEDRVPSDAQIVGHTWRFVNKGGGPDRRFNNNRQIPEVMYQQMGLRGPGGFQKVLHLSRVADRSQFDAALAGLRRLIKSLKQLALEEPSVADENVIHPEELHLSYSTEQPLNGAGRDGSPDAKVEAAGEEKQRHPVLAALVTLLVILVIGGAIAAVVMGLPPPTFVCRAANCSRSRVGKNTGDSDQRFHKWFGCDAIVI
jgi:hypothetical protein